QPDVAAMIGGHGAHADTRAIRVTPDGSEGSRLAVHAVEAVRIAQQQVSVRPAIQRIDGLLVGRENARGVPGLAERENLVRDDRIDTAIGASRERAYPLAGAGGFGPDPLQLRRGTSDEPIDAMR